MFTTLIIGMKALMGTSRRETVVGVTCWELKSHLFKALVLPTFTYGTKIWGGDFHCKVSEKGMQMHMMSHGQSAFFDYLSHFVGRIWRTSHRTILSQAHYGLSTTACPPIPLLVSL